MPHTSAGAREGGGALAGVPSTLDLDLVTKVEARGNQVILTYRDDDSEPEVPEPALDEVSLWARVLGRVCAPVALLKGEQRG